MKEPKHRITLKVNDAKEEGEPYTVEMADNELDCWFVGGHKVTLLKVEELERQEYDGGYVYRPKVSE